MMSNLRFAVTKLTTYHYLFFLIRYLHVNFFAAEIVRDGRSFQKCIKKKTKRINNSKEAVVQIRHNKNLKNFTKAC
jgi:hypothetical protein